MRLRTQIVSEQQQASALFLLNYAWHITPASLTLTCFHAVGRQIGPTWGEISARSTCGPPATSQSESVEKTQETEGNFFLLNFLLFSVSSPLRQQTCQWQDADCWFLSWKPDHKREYNEETIHLACSRY